MKPKFVRLYTKFAKDVAELSYAQNAKVGCVVVKNNRIISYGYNGTPPGQDNVCEELIDGVLVTKPDVLHAEENAILKLAKDGESGLGSDVFVTLSPCVHCARMILGAGVRKVFYSEDYRDSAGLNFLQNNGVEVEKFTI